MKPNRSLFARVFNSGGRLVPSQTVQKHNDHILSYKSRTDEIKSQLQMFLTDPKDLKKATVELPGVRFASDLPADPVTRLFFQVKGPHALYQDTFENSSPGHVRSYVEKIRAPLGTRQDNDRVALNKRPYLPMYDMAGRLKEGAKEMKRFVIVPSTVETKGVAQLMHNHGVIAGMRDFNNKRAFVVELKYYQGKCVFTDMVSVRQTIEDDETEYSPLMMRRFAANKRGGFVRIVCVRSFDGQILDQFTCRKKGMGGTGLCIFW
eukprot:PhF_6_TR6374/c0_g1_i1/m.9633